MVKDVNAERKNLLRAAFFCLKIEQGLGAQHGLLFGQGVVGIQL